MPVKLVGVLLALFFSFEASACRRTAINASTAQIKAVVELVNAQTELRSYTIDKFEVDGDRYTVFLEDLKKACKLTFKVGSDTACKAHVEPVGKIACP